MNFRIVESQSYDDIYEEFKDKFINPDMTLQDLMDYFDISFRTYNRLRKRACEDLGLKHKPFRRSNVFVIGDNTYIHQSGKKWGVVKTINSKRHVFGYYDTIDIARKVRDKLISVDWDKNMLDSIVNEVVCDEDY